VAKDRKTHTAAAEEERFEDQLARLEQVVARLEDEDVGLEEAVELFERGMVLARRCRARLEAVEQRVARLLEGDGPATTEPMDVETS
jgi:exodeoxyribonuclease VII small subunit